MAVALNIGVNVEATGRKSLAVVVLVAKDPASPRCSLKWKTGQVEMVVYHSTFHTYNRMVIREPADSRIHGRSIRPGNDSWVFSVPIQVVHHGSGKLDCPVSGACPNDPLDAHEDRLAVLPKVCLSGIGAFHGGQSPAGEDSNVYGTNPVTMPITYHSEKKKNLASTEEILHQTGMKPCRMTKKLTVHPPLQDFFQGRTKSLLQLGSQRCPVSGPEKSMIAQFPLSVTQLVSFSSPNRNTLFSSLL